MTNRTLPSFAELRDMITDAVDVAMPSGVYRVYKASNDSVVRIDRENPETGSWRIVWNMSMRKELGRRLRTVATLGGAKSP